MQVTARWSIDVTCPCCGGPLTYRSLPDPAAPVRRATVACEPCQRAWRLTVTLCPERTQ